MTRRPSNIVITGASSGIGAALAEAYAAGGITLGLLGRNEARLNGVAAACMKKGAKVETGAIDVRDTQNMRQWLTEFDASHPIHLLIANAGISIASGKDGETEQQIRDVFDINVGGVLNSVLPVAPFMQARKGGRIAIISSLAGLRGLPNCPAYSASKNAVRAWGEGLRGTLKDYNIGVSVVCPGYIRTPMTDANNFPMPFIMSPEKAAHIIKSGIERNRARIAFPLTLYLPLLLINSLPLGLSDRFFAALPRKTAKESI